MAKILIAEDDPKSRDLLTRLLEGWGHQIVPACDGVEALELAERERFHLVLTDWVMPGLTGIELCETLKGRSSTQSIPVIMLSVKKSGEDIAEANDAGVDDYITKPFDREDLQARVVRALSVG